MLAAWEALGAGLDSYLGSETLSLEQLFYTWQNAKRRRRDAFGEEDLAMLPEGTPELRLGRCALVGSSGIVNGRRKGADIDAHDTVMRINNAPVTAEYAPDVGTKTTVRVLNKKWSQVYGHSRPDLLKMDSGKEVKVIGTRVDVRDFAALARGAAGVSEGSGTRFSALYMNPKAVRQGWDLLSALRTALGEATGREYKGRNAITTGALGLFLLLQGCDSIDAYGFSLEPCPARTLFTTSRSSSIRTRARGRRTPAIRSASRVPSCRHCMWRGRSASTRRSTVFRAGAPRL